MDLNAGNTEQPLLDESEWPIDAWELNGLGVGDAALPTVARGMQVLMEAGLAPEDVADVIYNHPGVLDALKIREYDTAKLLSFRFISEDLMQLRDCGVSEDRLLVLSESGLAVGEISFAIQHVVGCRDGLIEADADGLKRRAKTLYEFYREARLTRRPLRPQRSFFERYAGLMKPSTVSAVKKVEWPTAQIGGISDTKVIALPLEFPPPKYQTEETKRAIRDTRFQEEWSGVILTILFIVIMLIMFFVWGRGSGPDIGAGG
jgi:hypothetical protein